MSHIDDGELTAYADGAYGRDSAEAQQIAAHLAACANCRNRLADAQALSGRASEILSFAAPERIVVPALPLPKRSRTLPLAWAATVVLAVGLGWLLRGEAPRATPQIAMTPSPAHPATPAQKPASDSTPRLAAAVERKAAPAKADQGVANNVPAPSEAKIESASTATEVSAAPAFASAPPPSAPSVAVSHYIPELPIVSIDGASVQQRLPDGVIITLSTFQPTGEASKLRSADAVAEGAVAPRATLLKDGVLIELKGPLSVDSLRNLLRLVR